MSETRELLSRLTILEGHLTRMVQELLGNPKPMQPGDVAESLAAASDAFRTAQGEPTLGSGAAR